MPTIPFAIEYGRSRSPTVNVEELNNFFVEIQPEGAKSQAPMFGAPGLSSFAQTALGAGPIRGAWLFGDTAYFVSGDRLYSVSNAGVVRDVGFDGDGNSVSIPGTAIVSMSDNGVQMIMVQGSGGWLYTVAGGLTPITDPDFPVCKVVTFMDGYFLVTEDGTNNIWFSDLYDGASWNANDEFVAEAQPGFAIGLIQNLELLFIFCSGHIEVWYDAGSESLPFQRYSGGVIPYGCISPYTILRQDGAVWFLGSDKTFYRLQNNQPLRVSTHAIERLIALDGDIENAECMTYTIEGHKFVALTLTGLNKTVVYDCATLKWHVRESWGSDNKSLGRWRGRFALETYKQILIGDAFDGTVGRVNWVDAFTEYGNIIPGRIVSLYEHKDRMRVFVDRLELDIEAGVGLENGQGEDPQIMLRWSRDGGRTWSDYQPWRSMGKQGEYLRRLRWLAMGNARQWAWELTVTDPVWRTIVAAHADLLVSDG